MYNYTVMTKAELLAKRPDLKPGDYADLDTEFLLLPDGTFFSAGMNGRIKLTLRELAQLLTDMERLHTRQIKVRLPVVQDTTSELPIGEAELELELS